MQKNNKKMTCLAAILMAALAACLKNQQLIPKLVKAVLILFSITFSRISMSGSPNQEAHVLYQNPQDNRKNIYLLGKVSQHK